MVQKVTLDDVARLSGVSRAAASRAINGKPGVRSDVRERVNRIADHLGFRPNRAAKNLASGLSSVIGLVIPSDDLRVDPYGASMTHAVGRAASARDLGLMLHLAADEPGTTVHHILRDGLIDGLLISSVAIGRPWVDELFDSSLPTVLLGTHPTRDDVVSVDVENLDASASAVGHLLDQGCERVGMITGLLDRRDARDRVAGFRLAHEQRGRSCDESLIVGGRFTRVSGAEAADLLLDVKVDAIFASNDEMAVGAMWACTRRGARVPDDVLLVGFDGTAIDEFIEPSLSTVVQPFDQIAIAAIDRLISLVEGRDDVTSMAIVPELVKGGSSNREHAR